MRYDERWCLQFFSEPYPTYKEVILTGEENPCGKGGENYAENFDILG